MSGSPAQAVPVVAAQIDVQLLDTLEQFSSLEQDWRRLTENSDYTIFNAWDWNWLWWQHYGDQGQLHILVARHEGRVVGIAPLCKTITHMARVIKLRTIQFIGQGGNTSPDDLNFIVDREYESVALQALAEQLFVPGSTERIQLNEIPKTSKLLQVLNTLTEQHQLSSERVFHRRCSSVLPDTWAAFRDQISRNTHKQIKRRANRLAREANIQFVRCDNAADIEKMRLALERLHQERWHSKGKAGNFRSKRYSAFHKQLMHALHARDELFLLGLKLNDEIIGVEYAFFVNRTLALFQTGFDPKKEHLSPGHVLMTEAIKQAIAMGAKRLDLLKGEYAYKSSYAKDENINVDIDIHKSNAGALLARIRAGLQPRA